jgi:hypothetical protein
LAKKKEVLLMPEEIYKPKDAAPVIGTTQGMLSQMRHRGIGPKYILVGKAVRYKKSHLEEYLTSRTVVPGAPLPKGGERARGGPGRGRKGKMPPKQKSRVRRFA